MAKRDQYQNRYPRWLVYTVLFSVIMIAVVITYLVLENRLQNQFQALLVSVSVNAWLTVALIGVYSQMNDAMEAQSKIMENQQRLLEIQQKPHVEVGDYMQEEQNIDIWVSNYGQGLAKNLQLITVLDFEQTEGLRPASIGVPLYRIDDGEHRLERSIRPHETDVRFSAKPKMGLKRPGDPEGKPRGLDFRSVPGP